MIFRKQITDLGQGGEMNTHSQNKKQAHKSNSSNTDWLNKPQCPKELRRWAGLMADEELVASLPSDLVVRTWGRAIHFEENHEEVFTINEDLERSGRSF